MTFPSFTTYLVELVFCAFAIVAVRTIGGRWIGPGARRLLWVLLILKALVPLTVPTAYHPLGALAKLETLTAQEPAASAHGDAALSPGIEAVGPAAIAHEDMVFTMIPHGTIPPGTLHPDEPSRPVAVSPAAAQPTVDAPGLSVPTVLRVVWGLGTVVLLGMAVLSAYACNGAPKESMYGKLGKFVSEGLDIKTEKRILLDYYNTYCEDSRKQYGMKLKDIRIDYYYGSYNGCYVFHLDAPGWWLYLTESEYYDFNGFKFSCPYNKNPKIWQKGVFYKLTEAYNSGLLTIDDIRTIANYFKGDE